MGNGSCGPKKSLTDSFCLILVEANCCLELKGINVDGRRRPQFPK